MIFSAYTASIPLPKADRQDLEKFCRIGADRYAVLTQSLSRRGIPHQVIPLAGSRHIFLTAPAGQKSDCYRTTFVAHYDKVPHSPGANDNGAAVFQLMAFWEDMRREGVPHQAQIIFTDREELSEGMHAGEQGSRHLAQHLRRLGVNNILFFVLDMCGIGDTPVWGRSRDKVGLKTCGGAVSRVHNLMEEFLLRYSKGTDYGINPEFSDDLGLLLGGYPAIQLSLLPRPEANQLRMYMKALEAGAGKAHPNIFQPSSWQLKHTPNDDINTLEPRAFSLMSRLLRDIARYRFPLP
ncbi:MAG: hypothetical protein B0D92_07655 [Spirochaeta sp. LUC14_002_19_P3]|nr:MAG: hypothetical protein B0D92_07655 [Spirochaeta sp. LUC14_002_19_P3]